MAVKDNKKRGELDEPTRWSSELQGILWITGGLLLLLSLVKYSPGDLPKGTFLAAFAGSGDPNGENLIGPVGGVLGFIQILLFGAAGYLLPVGFIWFGIVKLALDVRIWPRVVLGLVILLSAAATWLDAADYFFKEWARFCRLSEPGPGPGGVIGEGLGGYFLVNMIGRTGTLIVVSLIYVVGLIMLTGHHPFQFSKECYEFLRDRLDDWRANRRETGLAAAREAEILAERESQREQRRKEREVFKPTTERMTPTIVESQKPERAVKIKQEPESELEEESEYDSEQIPESKRVPVKKELPAPLPQKENPPPQIIDASQRRLSSQHVTGGKPFERKKPTEHQFLSVNGFENYELPGFDLLDVDETIETPEANREELLTMQRTIVETLLAFGIEVTAGDITRGPTITRYEIYPSVGLRVSRISQLEADLARATCAEQINILAPIPGKDTVGIEIANSVKVAVPLHELLHDPEFRSAKKKIPLALGKDVYGKTVIADLAAMPHCLVAGATGSGKSVCINSIIASMLFKFGPDELRFIMVDPKVVEMQMYNRLPHLVVPVVTDPKKTVAALKWVVNEMEKRYRIFAKVGVRNFDSFNARPRPEKVVPEEEPEEEENLVDLASDEEIESMALALESGELGPESDPDDDEAEIYEEQIPDRIPYIVVLIDELADLMQTAPADVEMCIARIAQKARAAGIHLIIATQTPRADVVTGIIKANIPSRIAFQVSSALDSRVILDTKGADKLVGKGDMLYLPPGSAKLERAQGAYVTDAEIERIIEHCAQQGKPKFETDIVASINHEGDGDDDDISQADEELILKCIEVVRVEQKASASLLQRRLRLGYTRASRMIDILELRGIVGPGEGAKPREVFLK